MAVPALTRPHAQATSLPPGPPLPMIASTLLWQFAFERYATLCERRYGHFYTIKLPISRAVVAVSDPDAIKGVFADRGEATHAGEGNIILEPVLGKKSLLLLDGPEHTRHRKLIHPPFHGARM